MAKVESLEGVKNFVLVEGYVAKEPRLGELSKGVYNFASFTVAIKDERSTIFIDCVAFRKKKEEVEDLTKGSLVRLNGYLSCNKYKNKEGKTISRISVIVNRFEIKEKKEREEIEQDDTLPF